MLDMFSLEGKLAIVTGSARGIGQSYAVGLAKAGATLVLVDILEDNLKETAQLIKDETGRDSKTYGIDVTDSAKINSMVKEIIAEYHKIDILVNNAGINALNTFLVVGAVNPNATFPLFTASSISSLLFTELGDDKEIHWSLPNKANAMASAPPEPVSQAPT